MNRVPPKSMGKYRAGHRRGLFHAARTRNAISPKLYNARVPFSFRSQNDTPSSFPDFHPGRSGFAVSFIFFHLIGICRGFCPSSAYFTSSPPGPALHSPVTKVSLLFSFQPPPVCSIVSFPLRTARLCIPPSRKFLCFFLFKERRDSSLRNPFLTFFLISWPDR